MSRELFGRDRNGRMVRIEVDDTAEIMFREERSMAMIRGHADRMGLNFSEAADQLNEQGVDLSSGFDGAGAVTLSSSDDGRPDEAHDKIVAELSARNLGHDKYGEVAQELAERGVIDLS